MRAQLASTTVCVCSCVFGLHAQVRVVLLPHCHQGVNTEKYVPNPRHTSPLALSMFDFVGRLIGIVLRHKNYLPFELPPLVRWVVLGV